MRKVCMVDFHRPNRLTPILLPFQEQIVRIAYFFGKFLPVNQEFVDKNITGDGPQTHLLYVDPFITHVNAAINPKPYPRLLQLA